MHLGELPDRIATAMSAVRVHAPAPPDRPDDTEDSDDDDDRLPMYKCALCDGAVVLGGGGVLKCSTCRSRRGFHVSGSVVLLGLRAAGMNHRQGEVVCRRSDRYGVLLVGASEPAAVRPANLRPIDGALSCF